MYTNGEFGIFEEQFVCFSSFVFLIPVERSRDTQVCHWHGFIHSGIWEIDPLLLEVIFVGDSALDLL